MKINTSYFPSVIILLGVFIFISLFFGTGNVIPYSKVSNFSSFEGFDQNGGGDETQPSTTGNEGGIMSTMGNVANSVASTLSDAASTVSTAATNVLGGGSTDTPNTDAGSSPGTTVSAAPVSSEVKPSEGFTSFSLYK